VESEAGIDSVEFMFNANPGQSVQALRRVASGGELARLTLAIKVATVAQDDVPVLLFDEVDIGVGGAIAAVIGAKLKQLAQHRQVLVITHSPQLAAFGHQHLRASKQVLAGQTVSRLESLDGAARVEELARMLAGSKVNAESLANAKALLKEAGFGVGSR
jgi:DNA repair protein RecN (Recombination protein N)